MEALVEPYFGRIKQMALPIMTEKAMYALIFGLRPCGRFCRALFKWTLTALFPRAKDSTYFNRKSRLNPEFGPLTLWTLMQSFIFVDLKLPA